MNLRMEGQELRFRISKEELEAICEGKTLAQSTSMPDGRMLKIGIAAGQRSTPLSFAYTNDRMTLQVSTDSAISLRDALPSREGLEAIQPIDGSQTLRLLLEVDIRTQKRKRSE